MLKKTVYIAEKPDIGRAVAAYLWPDGGMEKGKGCFRKGDIAVTWAFGHILGMATPELYGEEYKVWSNYPILPSTWIMKPDPQKKEQLDIIKGLIKEADVVIHAGDPDREGQLLIDEILDFLHYKGEVRRILINAKDDESLKRAFSSLRDNKDFYGLYEAGLGRARADWLIGMNLSRAYTVNARKAGHDGTYRIGRVKVPTLALVVQREKDILSFKPKKYYVLQGIFAYKGIPFTATLEPSENIPLDEEGRVLDVNLLQAIKLKVEKAEGVIRDVATSEGKQYPPLPYSLDTLQIEANKIWGYSPQEVLETVQKLYERKLVSYPRSDCNYIPASQREDVPRILAALKEMDVQGAAGANVDIESKAFNDGKITAHHAIIPTGIRPEDMNEQEERIYGMISKRYIVQFYPPHEFEKTTFSLQVGDEMFSGSGKIIRKMGFREVEREEEEQEGTPRLPDFAVGDKIAKGDYSILNKKTKPPKRFTEGTLIAAMTNIWKFMKADNPNREKMKEVKGIGTPATRDTIIAELQATSLKGKAVEPCLKKVKKEILPTPFGISLIENVSPSLAVPDTTAEMEYALDEIAHGKGNLSDYMDDVYSMVHENIQFAEKHLFPLPKDKKRTPCPICREGILLRKYSQKSKMYFHMCSNEKCISPDTGRKMFYPDDSGEPVVAFCPECETVLAKLNGKNGAFWLCNHCKKTFDDKNGHPVLKKDKVM